MRAWPIIIAMGVSPIIAAVVCGLALWSVHLWILSPWVIASTGLALLVGGAFLAWYAAKSVARRRFRFRLHATLVAAAAVAAVLIVASRVHFPWLSERYALQAVIASGGSPRYWPQRPANWLEGRLGYDSFEKVVEIDVGPQTIPVLLEHKDHLPNLVQLSFGRGSTDASVSRAAEFDDFPQLRSGTFVVTPLTDRGLANLEQWSRVESLFFNGCAFTDNGLAHLARLPALQALTLIGDEGGSMLITDAGMTHLGNMPRLTDLRLIGLPITDAGLKELTKLSSLERLLVRRTLVTEEGLERLRRELPDCWATGLKGAFPTVQQTMQICVRDAAAADRETIVIRDSVHIAAIKSCLERFIGQSSARWKHEWPGDDGSGVVVEFEGRMRRLCSCRVGKGFFLNPRGLYRSMTDEESRELRSIIARRRLRLD